MIEANQGRIQAIREKTKQYKQEINQKKQDLEDICQNEAAKILKISQSYIESKLKANPTAPEFEKNQLNSALMTLKMLE